MSENLGTILGAASIAVALGVAYVVFRMQRTPGRLSHVTESCIALFARVAQTLPGIAVSYKERPVDPGLVLLRGILLNTCGKLRYHRADGV